jgi:hypothetical protein
MTKRKGNRRDAIRMAVLLRERIVDSQKSELPVLPKSQWLLCQRSARLYEKAVRRGWHAAARQIRPHLVRQLSELQKATARTLTWENKYPISLHDAKILAKGCFNVFTPKGFNRSMCDPFGIERRRASIAFHPRHRMPAGYFAPHIAESGRWTLTRPI